MIIRIVLITGIAFSLIACQQGDEYLVASCNSANVIKEVKSEDADGFSNSQDLIFQENKTASTSLFNIFDTSLWPARWNCGVWTPEHGWLYIGSDLAIWVAYFAIPFILGFFYLRQKDEIPFRLVFLLFIGFIVACGLTHLIDAIIFWWPAYKLSAMLRFGTALISWTTVIALVKVLPEAKELKGVKYLQNEVDDRTSELKTTNEKLEERIEAEIKLKEINAGLVDKISAQNDELVKKNESLKRLHDLFESVQSAAEIGIWEINLNNNSVYWSDAVYKIHEVEIGTPISLEQGINFYHPDYRQTIEQAVSKAINDGTGWDLELILITKSNNEIWVRAKGMPIVVDGKTVLLRGLFQDITNKILLEKRKQAINELLEKKVKQRTIELESINKELNAFSYSVSHDLRSPLRSISGFSQALKEDYFDKLDDGGKNYLERISNAAIRMGRLIDDLLDLSRISRKDIVNEEVDLSKLCHEIINEKNQDTNYQFKVQENMIASGDAKLFRIMLENLIDNAIKYSSKVSNPLIEVGENELESCCHTFFVKDNGAGFNPEYADKLFGAFQRLHTVDEFEGIGIGLATVKRIISKHGGQVWAESQVNEGATFYFTLNN